MKQYIKDGVIKTRNNIVLRVNRVIEDKDGTHKEVTLQVFHPSEEMILADGWVEYKPPQEDHNLHRITLLKRELSQSDYKVIKCMEATLCGEELPYDIDALHEERNRIRAQVNALESNIAGVQGIVIA